MSVEQSKIKSNAMNASLASLVIDESETSLALAGLSIVAERPDHDDESETLEDSLEDEESEEFDEDDDDFDNSRDTLLVGLSFERNW